MNWKQLSSKEVYRNPWWWVTEDQVETPSGKILMWATMHKDPFALIVPWDGERFILVRPYRYPVGKACWEFPAGSVDGASVTEAANQELRQETGYVAGSLEFLAKFFVANGSSAEYCQAYLATDLTYVGEQILDPGEEGMEIMRVTPEELTHMITDGTIADGPTLSAYGYLHAIGWFQKL